VLESQLPSRQKQFRLLRVTPQILKISFKLRTNGRRCPCRTGFRVVGVAQLVDRKIMKTSIPRLCAVILFGALLTTNILFAQGTAFSYQGKLAANGSAANGYYDLTFAIFDVPGNGNQIGTTLTSAQTGVTNGLFMVTLDFGSGVFTGPQRWLQIGVRTNGSSGNTLY
jgi:hypothetical protein